MRQSKKFSEKGCSFERSLMRESDRGCVLIGHATLDRALGKLLRSYFLRVSNSPRSSIDALLDGAVSTFAPRARLTCALGLISDRTLATLLELNALRVHFAHYGGLVTLNTKVIRKISQQLDAKDMKDAKSLGNLMRMGLHRRAKTPLPKHSRARNKFISITVKLLVTLLVMRGHVLDGLVTLTKHFPGTLQRGSTPQSSTPRTR